MENDMKKTCLHGCHIELEAKMAPFAGLQGELAAVFGIVADVHIVAFRMSFYPLAF